MKNKCFNYGKAYFERLEEEYQFKRWEARKLWWFDFLKIGGYGVAFALFVALSLILGLQLDILLGIGK